jgi:cullin 1
VPRCIIHDSQGDLETPASNKINVTDSFKANAKFTCACNMRKIRIPIASLDASHSNTKQVEADSLIAIEAAIVRLMKARKTLQHQQLIAKLLAQLPFFKPNRRVIKCHIEGLIEREYLERSADMFFVLFVFSLPISCCILLFSTWHKQAM